MTDHSPSSLSGEQAAALFLEIRGQLRKESDRGTVIVSAALVEEALEALLKARLAPTNGKDDELFDIPYAPLGTLSAKIDLAYRVGIIRAQLKSSLHLLRKMRNDFAHSSRQLDFTSRSVQGRIRELFKLNRFLLDSMCQALEKELKNSDSKQIQEILYGASSKDSSIKRLLELLNWRGLFDLFSALNCMALLMLPGQVEPMSALENLY